MMLRKFKKIIFQKVSFNNYLRLHQRGFFALYNIKLLKLSDSYNYHYNVNKLISKGDTIIDIGANLGYYTQLFSKWVGKNGKVYAVEPIRIFNNIFNEVTGKRKNVVLHPYALGTEEKKINLVSSPNVGYFRTGLPHIHDAERDGELESVEYSFSADMKMASKLFGKLDKINYIKCDIEGHELIVLTDMKCIIEKHLPVVQVEVWGQNQKKVMQLFEKMGYVAHKYGKKYLTPVGNKYNNIDGDYIFIHKKQLVKYKDLYEH